MIMYANPTHQTGTRTQRMLPGSRTKKARLLPVYDRTTTSTSLQQSALQSSLQYRLSSTLSLYLVLAHYALTTLTLRPLLHPHNSKKLEQQRPFCMRSLTPAVSRRRKRRRSAPVPGSALTPLTQPYNGKALRRVPACMYSHNGSGPSESGKSPGLASLQSTRERSPTRMLRDVPLLKRTRSST